jgi:hypothetical protein
MTRKLGVLREGSSKGTFSGLGGWSHGIARNGPVGDGFTDITLGAKLENGRSRDHHGTGCVVDEFAVSVFREEFVKSIGHDRMKLGLIPFRRRDCDSLQKFCQRQTFQLD